MPVWPEIAMSISNETNARPAVASIKDRGVDFIKVYSLIPRKAYFALADEAKKRGIPFAGHVPISVTAFEASDAGQKSIEHMEGILRACSAVEPELRKTLEDALKDARDTDQMRASLVRALYETDSRAWETYSQEKAEAVYSHICLPTATDQDLLPPTRKTYGGRLELGEDLMVIEVGEKIEVRKPARSSP
jgi:hypothetical protein